MSECLEFSPMEWSRGKKSGQAWGRHELKWSGIETGLERKRSKRQVAIYRA